MKRHDALIPLTHDHHHALVRTRRLRLAASGEDLPERRAAGEDFLRFFEEHTLLHFREEEEILLPLVIDHPGCPVELVRRLLVEHVRIHRLVGSLRSEMAAGEPSRETLGEISRMLSGHIRTEEGELFPAIERLVGEDELRSMRLAPRDREPPPGRG